MNQKKTGVFGVDHKKIKFNENQFKLDPLPYHLFA
jgi:hypothetical protein